MREQLCDKKCCSFSEPLGEKDCDFENMLIPFCAWDVAEGDNAKPWIWWSGPPDSLTPGPSTDHTYGTGSDALKHIS